MPDLEGDPQWLLLYRMLLYSLSSPLPPGLEFDIGTNTGANNWHSMVYCVAPLPRMHCFGLPAVGKRAAKTACEEEL